MDRSRRVWTGDGAHEPVAHREYPVSALVSPWQPGRPPRGDDGRARGSSRAHNAAPAATPALRTSRSRRVWSWPAPTGARRRGRGLDDAPRDRTTAAPPTRSGKLAPRSRSCVRVRPSARMLPGPRLYRCGTAPVPRLATHLTFPRDRRTPVPVAPTVKSHAMAITASSTSPLGTAPSSAPGLDCSWRRPGDGPSCRRGDDDFAARSVRWDTPPPKATPARRP